MMEKLIGNAAAKTTLSHLLNHHTVPSTLLFYGMSGVGKSQFALALTEGLMGEQHIVKLRSNNHPDLHTYAPEGKSAQHPIENIRGLIHEVSLPPFEAQVKVFILHDAHRMHSFSANALLKTLEEPPEDTYFVLLTDEIEAMLPTIVSRCRKIPFFPIPREEIESFVQREWKKKPEEARRIAFLSHGSLGKAKQWSAVEGGLRAALLEVLALDPIREYPQLSKGLTHLQELVDKGGEESVLAQADFLLEETLHWYRDRHLLRQNVAVEFLYHLDQLDALHLSASHPLPLLEHLVEATLNARLGLQRSIKLKTVLEYFLTHLA